MTAVILLRCPNREIFPALHQFGEPSVNTFLEVPELDILGILAKLSFFSR